MSQWLPTGPGAALTVVEADITTLAVDAIVNAANERLAGGGGVDGAIHRAAGPELVRASMALAPCPPGEVRVTPGFNLPAKFVIHTVGPVWNGGDMDEAQLLAGCYRNAILAAGRIGAGSIAFPAISTGIYGYPPQLAAPVAVKAAWGAAAMTPSVQRVLFCCFGAESADLHRAALAALFPGQKRR